MWSNLLSSGEAAKERFTNALKETNEALSQRASAHVQQIRISQSNDDGNTSSTSPTTATATSVTPSQENNTASSDTNIQENQSKDISSQNSIFSFNSVLGTKKSPSLSSSTDKPSLFSAISSRNQQGEIFDSLKAGWGNVVEVTKNVVETTRDVVEKEQTRIQATLFANGPYTRGKKQL